MVHEQILVEAMQTLYKDNTLLVKQFQTLEPGNRTASLAYFAMLATRPPQPRMQTICTKEILQLAASTVSLQNRF